MDKKLEDLIAAAYELGYQDGEHDKGIEGISHLKPGYKHHKETMNSILDAIKEDRIWVKE